MDCSIRLAFVLLSPSSHNRMQLTSLTPHGYDTHAYCMDGCHMCGCKMRLIPIHHTPQLLYCTSRSTTPRSGPRALPPSVEAQDNSPSASPQGRPTPRPHLVPTTAGGPTSANRCGPLKGRGQVLTSGTCGPKVAEGQPRWT